MELNRHDMDNVSIGYALFTSPRAKPSHKLAITRYLQSLFCHTTSHKNAVFYRYTIPEFTLRKQRKVQHQNSCKLDEAKQKDFIFIGIKFQKIAPKLYLTIPDIKNNHKLFLIFKIQQLKNYLIYFLGLF